MRGLFIMTQVNFLIKYNDYNLYKLLIIFIKYFKDSIIYYTKEGDFEPSLGDGLGELTNELTKCDGDYIVEGVFSGPKNYSYKTNNGTTKCVVKGFSVSYITSLNINFESLKEIVLNDREARITVDQMKFKRSKNSWDINTSVIKKIYKFVYDKRILIENYNTLPYGF